jgi:phytoene dehydrogenase-like protein
LAPIGHDTVTVAIPVPHLDEDNPQDWEALKVQSWRYILKRFQEISIFNFDEHVKFKICYSPMDWKKRYNLTKGSAHGLSHEIFQMGYLRPKNQHPCYRNLFFVGASTHPGTGLPSVLVSAKHVSNRILETVKVPQQAFEPAVAATD